MARRKQKDRATEYATDVLAGYVAAGRPHILSCKRHLDDLKKNDFPYVWDPVRAERILAYAEQLTIAEGQKPKPVRLHPFQTYDIGSLFGWVERDTHFRRFRRSYDSMARQNGKTFINGINGSYIAGFSGYQYGKLFTAATKKRQSKLAWDEIMRFILADPELSDLFKIQEYKALITALETNCTIEALSKEGGLDDGFRAIFISLDEVHQHRDNSIYKALYNGTRSLDETLLSMITTRGFNLNSFCKEMDDYALGVLKGVFTAEDLFVDIYCPDEEDDWFSDTALEKANPHLWLSERGRKNLRADAQTARDQGGSELRDYVTKALNLWYQSSEQSYVVSEEWKQCGSDRTLESFRGETCTVGLDLSSGGDLTTLALEFKRKAEEERIRYYLYSHSFMPRARLDEHIKTDIAPYDTWEKQQLLTVTGGQYDYKNDYRFILNHLRELQELYDLKFAAIGYDPHNADAFLAELETFGCPLIEIRQSARTLNDGTDYLRLCIRSGEYEYDQANELLTWSFINAKIVRNSFDEIKVDKEPGAKYKRIDPVDAAIDAHIAGMKVEAAPSKVDYNSEMERYLAAIAMKGGGGKNENH